MIEVFDWWAEIWIPSALGVATVVVAVAALIASARATRMSQNVERYRIADEQRRRSDADRDRLIAMSQKEARLLLRWVHEAYVAGPWPVMYPLGAPPPPPTPLKITEVEATTALEISLVPGAAMVLELTQFDLSHRHEGTEEGSEGLVSDAIPRARRERTTRRIAAWGRDPEAALDHLQLSYAVMTNDSRSYFEELGRSL